MLSGKNILLGVTAGIAAYKTAALVRLLKKAKANVRVVMTPDAVDFVTPLTLSTLSENPVLYSFADEETEEWNNHVELGLWADLFIVAPATANTIAKMANGICDNLLMATYLSAKCDVFVCPAMDLDMYQHQTTQDNLNKLQKNNNIIIDAREGELASGLVGKGRMEEPEQIISFITNHLKEGLPLIGKKVVVTAGPTYEKIDPVRFIGNNSSGRMGFELAKTAYRLGADVILISGPSNISLEESNIQRIDVYSASEMLSAVQENKVNADVIIMAAAVADYTPMHTSNEKIKKHNTELKIELTSTTDILALLGSSKSSELLVGFALETNNELENAKDKLKRKNLDLIILNSLNDAGAGFEHETNKVTFIDKNNNIDEFELKPKSEVAKDVFNKILSLLS